MNNKQLVTEITQYVEAISLAEAKNYFTPQYNQQKTFACFNVEFRIHGDFSNKQPGIFSQLLARVNATTFLAKPYDLRINKKNE